MDSLDLFWQVVREYGLPFGLVALFGIAMIREWLVSGQAFQRELSENEKLKVEHRDAIAKKDAEIDRLQTKMDNESRTWQDLALRAVFTAKRAERVATTSVQALSEVENPRDRYSGGIGE